MANSKEWHDLVRAVATAPHQIVALDAAMYLESKGYALATAAHANVAGANARAHRQVDPILENHIKLDEIRGKNADERRRARARQQAAARSKERRKAKRGKW